jgi:RNA polymerase sigma-70 factor (ECF subfamily)
MVDEREIEAWFCDQVLPLEKALTSFIRRNWRIEDDVVDLLHDIYEQVIAAARGGVPSNTPAYVFTTARNHLINKAKRARIVAFDLVADMETIEYYIDQATVERQFSARDELRRFQAGVELLSPRVREAVILRKVEGLSAREAAHRMGTGIDAVNRQLAMGMKALADFMLGGSGKIVRQKSGGRDRPYGQRRMRSEE